MMCKWWLLSIFLPLLHPSLASLLPHITCPSLYLACVTNWSNKPCGISFTSFTEIWMIFLDCNGGNVLNSFMGLNITTHKISHKSSPPSPKKEPTYLWAANNSFLMSSNCATTHKIFKCGPYASKKSQRINTSGNGGVHALRVSTATQHLSVHHSCMRCSYN